MIVPMMLLTFVLLFLKLVGVISISYFWCFFPVILVAVLVVFPLSMVFFFGALAILMGAKINYKK